MNAGIHECDIEQRVLERLWCGHCGPAAVMQEQAQSTEKDVAGADSGHAQQGQRSKSCQASAESTAKARATHIAERIDEPVGVCMRKAHGWLDLDDVVVRALDCHQHMVPAQASSSTSQHC